MNLNCDVCNEYKPTTVHASTLGGISFRYCIECLNLDAEPYGMLVQVLSIFGTEWEQDIEVSDWIKPIVESTLQVSNKSHEDLRNDIAAILQEEDEYNMTLKLLEEGV